MVKPHLDGFKSREEDKSSAQSTLVLLLGVSGGCDSVALFHSVLGLTTSREDEDMLTTRYLHLETEDDASLYNIACELHVAHFNHQQRGKNSDADEALVQRLCSESAVTFHSYSWSQMNNDISNDESTFSQDIARKWRRTQMVELLRTLVAGPNKTSSNNSYRWGAILTAHRRDDADETILLKLLRGAHLTNLSGMEDRSDGFELDAEGNCGSIGYFAKPLLGVRKIDIVDYLEANRFDWREDESNSENKYKRNKVRNQLMPLLSEIAGGEDALHVSTMRLSACLLISILIV